MFFSLLVPKEDKNGAKMSEYRCKLRSSSKNPVAKRQAEPKAGPSTSKGSRGKYFMFFLHKKLFLPYIPLSMRQKFKYSNSMSIFFYFVVISSFLKNGLI